MEDPSDKWKKNLISVVSDIHESPLTHNTGISRVLFLDHSVVGSFS